MASSATLEFRSRAGAVFEVALGAVVADSPSSMLRRGERIGEGGDLPRQMVVKMGGGGEPAEFGRLDLEQIACERLDHPSLSHYWGAARSDEFGTVLAFELLEDNPLLDGRVNQTESMAGYDKL